MLTEFCSQYGLPFKDLTLLKLALTHRSYLSVTGQGPRESNERLEFLGDSVLGLVTSEFLYRRHPDEHEGQLTKIKSLLVSKAILSRRALRIGLGRFVLMSHSEVESGGRQRLSILADAFESVIGAVYLDQGFEPARAFIHKHLLAESDAITSDKRHTNYKSHLQEYVQNAFRTHPVYRIRSEYGPDHSKHFMVEVMVGKRTLGEGRGHNKKEAEQAAARDALEKVERLRRRVRDDEDRAAEEPQERERGGRSGGARREPPARREPEPVSRASFEPPDEPEEGMSSDDAAEGGETTDRVRRRRRSRRGGRMRHGGQRGGPEGEAGSELEPAPPTAFDDPEVETIADTAFEVVAPGEPAPRRGGVEPSPAEAWEEPASESERETAFNTSTAAPGRGMRFGRGRRRDPVAAAAPGESRARGGAPEAAAEDRRVDVFASSPQADDAPPDVAAAAVPIPGATPIVDVTAEEGEGENERDREARIDEMERALESFGRRRTSDYGRRGRRR